MKRETTELLVGVFVVVGILCAGYMSVHLGKMQLGGSNEYTLLAKFDSVSGLKRWADVEISGIKVGRVADLSLDMEDQVAVVRLRIDRSIKVGDDVIASVKTSGLIGDKYIKLTPGGSLEYLGDGDVITETESAVDLEALISKYAFGEVE